MPVLSKCTGGPCQTLTTFKDPAGLTNNEPTQLTEYTFGALNFNVPASAPYGLNLHNVDYDVSFVDATYMPAAMEPHIIIKLVISAAYWLLIRFGQPSRVSSLSTAAGRSS